MFQVLGQSIAVEEAQAIKDKSDKIDMRFKMTKTYELQFPDFFNISLSGWFCKVYTNFPQERPFIDIPGGFGNHPTNRLSLHLRTSF